MKKLFLTMASLVMLASMAFAQNDPTPMLPSQHGLTDHQPAWGSSQTFDLTSGWNWWSTYINVTDITALETALDGHATQIKSNSASVTYNPSTGQWLGSFDLDNTKMYAINMASAYDEARLSGPRANVDEAVITVQTGWNWVGYPVNFEMPAAAALENYQAQAGDIYKGQGSFVTYSGTQWLGTLQLQPGKGYKLKSTSSATTSFTYPSSYQEGGRLVANYIIDNPTEWQPQMASNPDNMNMIAVINLNDEELRSENVEIGVFNGETCRGAVRPIYAESLDRYIALLTMYGENGEPYSFRLLDEMGDVYESNEASVSFSADAVIGSLHSPFELKFNTKNMVANNLHLFPNPVNQGEMVNMILPCEGVMTIEVVNMMGSTVKSMRMAQGSELSADMAPGVYTVKVTDAEGRVYVDKLIVK